VASRHRVAVVGGGWSGIAAAVELVRAGSDVTLIDAAPQLGGRARRVEVTLGDRRYALDNGQHLLIGAYRDTLALMARVGVDPDRALLRLPFALRYADGFALRAAALPAPLHLAFALLTARGLPWSARLAMLRAVERWKRAGWRADDNATADALMQGQPTVLVERVWEPLCVAALNVRLREAAAQVLLTVLRDSLGADRRASDLLLPRGDLSTVLPDAAAAWLAQHGADVLLRTPVASLAHGSAGWTLHARDRRIETDAVLIAVPPDRAAALLHSVNAPQLSPAIALLERIRSAPIATAYLRYPAGTRLPHGVYALREDPARGQFGQWVFDRGRLDAGCDGVLSVVISAAGAHEALDHTALAAAVAAQLHATFALPAPIAARVIEDKRATVVPGPGQRRPPAALPLPGLALAADAADSPYPSTLEGSVRSGLAAARALLSDAAR
jgi:squalene-associated FAD-dependent desaturase